jgi:hypothetical protein
MGVDMQGGFSSLGVVIALSLVITLIFTSSQVYWINSRAGDIQFAADAGALAAENVVAEYYVIARTADAVVLTMTLFGMLVMGVSIILSLIPACQEIGAMLMKFAKNVFNVRDDIAKAASFALTYLQRVLPFVAIANAAVVVSANAPDGTTYIGLAILAPLEFEEIDWEEEGKVKQSAEAVEEVNEETSESTKAAEQAKERMDLALYEGWYNDCGKEAGYSMYERTVSKAGLSSTPRPTLDDWSFDVALSRARSYYQARLANDRPANSTPNEVRKHNVRLLYYEYALELLQSGYCIDTGAIVSIYFPTLPRTAADIRGSSLYSDRRFPVGSDNAMHGATTCPDYLAPDDAAYGSISDLANGSHQSCGSCGMTVGNVSSVFSANTNIETGFEYWYKKVAQAAEDYEGAANEYHAKLNESGKSAEEAIDLFQEALDAIKGDRIDPHPPGRKGCITIVIAPGGPSMPSGLQIPLLDGASSLPPRIAISAAALAKDTRSNILGDFFEGLKAKDNLPHQEVGLIGVDFVFDVWGGVLQAYYDGVNGLTKGVGDLLRWVTSNQSSALADWAEGVITEAFELFGLQPADLYAPKPLIVNSIHVARADSGGYASIAVMNVKQGYASLAGNGSGTITDMLIDSAGLGFEAFVDRGVEDGIELFRLSFGPSFFHIEIPVKVRLPQAIAESALDVVRSGLDDLQDRLHGDDYMEIWR